MKHVDVLQKLLCLSLLNMKHVDVLQKLLCLSLSYGQSAVVRNICVHIDSITFSICTKHFRKWTTYPHLGGTAGEDQLAEEIYQTWTSQVHQS